MRYFSCDSHVVEAREVFEGLEGRFGSRAPRIEHNFNGRPGDWLLLPGAPPVPVGRLGIAGHRLDEPETEALIARGYEGLNPGIRDPHRRLDEQDLDGIVGEVMYPSLNMFTFAISDRDVAKMVFERHNDWIVDYCSANPHRLIGIGCLPIPDIDAAIAEMTRAARKGVRGFAIPAHVSPERPYCHPDYDRFWAAAQDFGVPLTMHIFTGTSLDGGMPEHWGMPALSIKGYTLCLSTAVNTMIDLTCGGVCERFPNLKLVFSEFETGWVAHVIKRLDHAYYRAPSYAAEGLSLKPSEYFRRQMYVTFEDDAVGVLTRHHIGVDRMLWGNDYPHHDAIWPHSMETLERVFRDVPDDERERMVWSNTVELYGIDPESLPFHA
jgi:predicted TIM-barrel fold metal-dependent hydrolase